MSEDMTTKYQQHYNQVLSGTLTDTIMKSISYQANIKLANEIIAEQEKSITNLKSELDKSNDELETLKSNNLKSDNIKIVSLENTIKSNVETITRLNNELSFANKLKIEYENLKSQVNNVEVFRNQLIKEREDHASTKQYYENVIIELNEQIELLNISPKKKRNVKKSDVLNLVEIIEDTEIMENIEETTKDGGTF